MIQWYFLYLSWLHDPQHVLSLNDWWVTPLHVLWWLRSSKWKWKRICFYMDAWLFKLFVVSLLNYWVFKKKKKTVFFSIHCGESHCSYQQTVNAFNDLDQDVCSKKVCIAWKENEWIFMNCLDTLFGIVTVSISSLIGVKLTLASIIVKLVSNTETIVSLCWFIIL